MVVKSPLVAWDDSLDVVEHKSFDDWGMDKLDIHCMVEWVHNDLHCESWPLSDQCLAMVKANGIVDSTTMGQ